MLELSGARLVPGDDRRRRRRAAAAPSSACASTRVAGLLGAPIPRPRSAEILRALDFGVAEAPDGLDVTVPAFRRNDVTREADLIEEVARIDGLEKLPATLPARRGAAGRLTPEQRLRRRAEDALVGARPATRSSAGASPSPGWPTACACRPTTRAGASCVLQNPMTEDTVGPAHRRCSARCSTSPRHNAARGARRPRALRVGRRLPRRRPATARRTSTARSARCSPGACARRRGATAEPARADFFAAKGAARRALLDALRVPTGRSSGRDRAVPASRAQRRACWPAARTSAGSASCTRSSRAPGTSTRGAALFELDLDRAARARRRGAALRRPHELPRAAPGPRRSSLAEDVPAAIVLAVVREAGRRAAGRRRASSTSTTASRWGRGACRSRCALAFRAPDRTLTDEEVAPVRERDRRRAARRAWGVSCVPERRSSPAPPATPARWPRALLDAPPALRARRRSPSRSDAGTRLNDLYPHHRVPLTLEELDLDRHGEVDAAIVAYPHGAAAPVVAALRERGVRVVDLSRRLPPARPRRLYERLVRPAPRARAARRRRLRPARAATATQIARRRPRRQPRLLPDRGAARARAAGAPWLIADVVIDAKTGVSGAGRAPTDDDALRLRRRERDPLRRRPATATSPEIDQELAGARRPDPRDLRARTSCRSTRASSSPATCTLRRDRSTSTRCSPHAYADEPFVELAARPPGVRDVRDTNFCRIHAHVDERTRQGLRLRRDRQPVEGHRVAGGPEPQPDVRRSTRRTACCERLLRLALGRGARTGARRPPRAACPPASAPPASRAGIKPSGGTDLGLLVSDAPETTSAARFTRSGVLAAPVLVTRERCAPRRAARGRRQLRQRQRRHRRARAGRRGQDAGRRGAWPAGSPADQVAVASTGVIGVPLDTRAVVGGLARAQRRAAPRRRRRLRRGDHDHRRLREARARSRSTCRAGTVRLCAQAKGAGMISPGVRDDAVLRADRRRAGGRDRRPAARRVRQALVRPHLGRRPALDQRHGDPDVLGAPAACAVEPESEDELRFGEALDALLRQLALPIVRDGEGARRIGRVVVRGGHGDSVERAARAVANSPLVKAALHGGDPNWGRIAQAVGDGAARHRAAGGRRRDRGRAGVRRRRRDRPTTSRRWRRRWRATRSSTSSGCRATATRPRSSSPTSATST